MLHQVTVVVNDSKDLYVYIEEKIAKKCSTDVRLSKMLIRDVEVPLTHCVQYDSLLYDFPILSFFQ